MPIQQAPIADDGTGKPIPARWATWITILWQNLKGWRSSYTGAVVIDFGSVAAQSALVSTTNHDEARIGDVLVVGRDVHTAGIIFDAYCVTDGVVTIRAVNFSAASVDPASTNFRYIGFRQ